MMDDIYLILMMVFSAEMYLHWGFNDNPGIDDESFIETSVGLNLKGEKWEKWINYIVIYIKFFYIINKYKNPLFPTFPLELTSAPSQIEKELPSDDEVPLKIIYPSIIPGFI